MKYGQLNLGQIETLVNKLGGMHKVDYILRGNLEVTTKIINPIIYTSTIVVDETKSVEELQSEVGLDPDWSVVKSDRFPINSSGKKEKKSIALFYFGKNISREEAIEEMDKTGHKPATSWDLISFYRVLPGLNIEFGIVALGSEYDFGGKYTPYLHNLHKDGSSFGQNRIAGVTLNYGWGKDHILLAVRK